MGNLNLTGMDIAIYQGALYFIAGAVILIAWFAHLVVQENKIIRQRILTNDLLRWADLLQKSLAQKSKIQTGKDMKPMQHRYRNILSPLDMATIPKYVKYENNTKYKKDA